MKVIFMGTPDFACNSLQKLIDENYDVVAVFTAPPRPSGRGQVVNITPVHKMAQEHNIPVFTPTKLSTPEAYSLIDSIEAEVIVVVAYGLIIKEHVLKAKKWGCINLHPSKLPRFRGAAPLQHTILNGDLETAICTMQMDAGIDTGDILMQENITLPPNVTLKILHDEMAERGGALMIKTLQNISDIVPITQSFDGVLYANKITKDDAKLDWSLDARVLERKIRAFNPMPGAFFMYNNEIIKVFAATLIEGEGANIPGIIVQDNLVVACGVNQLRIDELQRAGKKRMTTKEFLLGYNLKVGTLLT
jgi:methionyl-tRNA formyltransferase